MADYLDDLDDDLDEEDEAATQAPREDRGNSSAFAQLRKDRREAVKRAKALEAELAELRPLRETIRSQQARDALKAVGLPEQMAGTFAKVYDGELNAEAARAFAEANGLAAPQQQQEQEAAAPFVPTVGGEAPGPKKMSWDDMMAQLTDPSTRDAALKAYADGRVEARS